MDPRGALIYRTQSEPLKIHVFTLHTANVLEELMISGPSTRESLGGGGIMSCLKAAFNLLRSHLISDSNSDSVHAGVCGCKCCKLIWTCLVWAASDSTSQPLICAKPRRPNLPVFTSLVCRGRRSNPGLPHPERTF